MNYDKVTIERHDMLQIRSVSRKDALRQQVLIDLTPSLKNTLHFYSDISRHSHQLR
jgi:hypothetical protein